VAPQNEHIDDLAKLYRTRMRVWRVFILFRSPPAVHNPKCTDKRAVSFQLSDYMCRPLPAVVPGFLMFALLFSSSDFFDIFWNPARD
jgi:hypothetical protein